VAFNPLDLSRSECHYCVFGIVAEADIEGMKISARRAHDEDLLSGRVIRAALMWDVILLRS
jgi:hypothetical protein